MMPDGVIVLFVMVLVLNAALTFFIPLYLLIRLTLSMRLCPPTPQDQLSNMLGEAFNPRYMSIDKPSKLRIRTPEMTDLESSASWSKGWRRLEDTPAPVRRHRALKFKVNSGFRREVQRVGHSEDIVEIVQPTPITADPSIRFLRGIRAKRGSGSEVPWKCETQVEWLDLGQHFFPRYIRQARCSRATCWYDFYQCVARAFTVKVLRRVSSECLPWSENQAQPVPRQPWVFEEIAVNFCCECVP